MTRIGVGRLPNRATAIVIAFLAVGWAAREVAWARTRAEALKSVTIPLDRVTMNDYSYEGKKGIGRVGLYLGGDTPASTKFVTGRFVLNPGQSPHPPHTHVEEEVMIVEAGTGEIFCDGHTTAVGPGSVMYTTPNAPHSIVNSGDKPLTFYFVKWAAKDAK